VTPVRAPEKVTVATPVDELTAELGMRIMRTPVDGAATGVTVPGLLCGVNPGSWTPTFVAVPVVITRMKTPFTPKLDALIVSEAVGVIAAGVVPAGTTVCEDCSAMALPSVDTTSADQRTVISCMRLVQCAVMGALKIWHLAICLLPFLLLVGAVWVARRPRRR
jgi:hypothetical protein